MSISAYKRLSYIFFAGLLPLIIWLTYSLSYQYLVDKELTSVRSQLRLFTSDLEAEIEKYSFLPRVLSRNQKLKDLLSQSHPSAAELSSTN
jgi:C4-dicarboxylate-specific signal transduction histidine kinase